LNDIARPDSGAGLGELHNLGSFAEAGINHQMPFSICFDQGAAEK
jgi:hypothetical protein